MTGRVFPPVSHGSRMRRRRAVASRGVWLGVALVLALTLLVTVSSWLGPGLTPVRADTDTNAQKVAVFEDATVGVNEVWDNVVVVGGDLLVEGTVKNVVVVVGGDVTLASTARVGERGRSQDAALVSVFGDVTVERGARVLGETVDVAGGSGNVTAGSVSDPFLRPWRTGAILNWVWSTIFLAVVAVIATAIAPRQVAVVSDRVRRHFFSSLGWGALGALIVVPIITVILVVTIIGILLVIPWLFIALPLLSLFGFVAVGAMVGRLFFRGSGDEPGSDHAGRGGGRDHNQPGPLDPRGRLHHPGPAVAGAASAPPTWPSGHGCAIAGDGGGNKQASGKAAQAACRRWSLHRRRPGRCRPGLPSLHRRRRRR